MPAKSEAQRRYIYVHFGANFASAHHFNNKGKLPAHVAKKKKGKKRRRKGSY